MLNLVSPLRDGPAMRRRASARWAKLSPLPPILWNRVVIWRSIQSAVVPWGPGTNGEKQGLIQDLGTIIVHHVKTGETVWFSTPPKTGLRCFIDEKELVGTMRLSDPLSRRIAKGRKSNSAEKIAPHLEQIGEPCFFLPLESIASYPHSIPFPAFTKVKQMAGWVFLLPLGSRRPDFIC